MLYEINMNEVNMKLFQKAVKVFDDKIDEVIVSKKHNKILLFTDVFFNINLFKELIKKN